MNHTYGVGSTVFETWIIKHKLGEGSYGRVFEIERSEFGQTYQAALKFVRLAKQLGEKQGISLADPRAFRMAAEAWDWGDGLSCAEYWRQGARGV